MHSVTIDNKKVSIQKFGAKEGWKLVRKLAALIGPSVADLADEKFSEAVVHLFDKLPEDEFLALLDQLTGVCLVDDAKYDSNHLGDYMFTLKVCKEVLEYNFSDFFSPIKRAMNAFGRGIEE